MLLDDVAKLASRHAKPATRTALARIRYVEQIMNSRTKVAMEQRPEAGREYEAGGQAEDVT